MRRRPWLAYGSPFLVLLSPSPGCSNVAGSVPGNDAGLCHTNPAADDDDDDAGDGGGGGACKPGDADGIIGGCYAFALTVDDATFTPIILKSQNLGEVTIKLTNNGSKPHDLVFGCIPTPSLNGCPAQSCFPAAANLAPVVPGATASTTFVAPSPEGIYVFRSDVAGDSTSDTDGGRSGLWGQFVVQ